MSEERSYKFAGFDVTIYPCGKTWCYVATHDDIYLSGTGAKSNTEAALEANQAICNFRSAVRNVHDEPCAD